jgi:hypothetical protein
MEPAPSNGGRGKCIYTIPQRLAVENKPVEIGISGFGIETSGF